jgi:hypothetical protein
MSETPDYKRVELVWPGKTTQVERVRLPFQVIERVNDVRRSERGQGHLLGTELPLEWPGNWRNKLIWGDNKYVLASLLDEFAGKVDLIYIDPPFATGQDFSFRIDIGEQEITKQASLLEETAYRDTWGRGLESYLQMMYERLQLIRELLSARAHCSYTSTKSWLRTFGRFSMSYSARRRSSIPSFGNVRMPTATWGRARSIWDESPTTFFTTRSVLDPKRSTCSSSLSPNRPPIDGIAISSKARAGATTRRTLLGPGEPPKAILSTNGMESPGLGVLARSGCRPFMTQGSWSTRIPE